MSPLRAFKGRFGEVFPIFCKEAKGAIVVTMRMANRINRFTIASGGP